MKAFAVIGSAFGDCGKGKHVDYLSAKYGRECVVVRSNGGAQAGHTVVTPEGLRHVFHHFGSGSFNGSATYLSEFFIVNPIIFRQEYEELVSKGVKPVVYVSPNCMVTTPYDMLINQMVEEMRGGAKHGSCGYGIHETITRHVDYNIPFHIDLMMKAWKNEYYSYLTKDIRDEYVPMRLYDLGIILKNVPSKYFELFRNENLLKRYVEDIEFFHKYTTMVDPDYFNDGYFKAVVFEGAQGLLLDEDHEFFPNVTRSKTGLHNVIELCKQMNITNINVSYLTRAYTTRHGAGPMPFELPEKPYINIEDQTNLSNEWQGSLRFSYLNWDLVMDAIGRDIENNCRKGIVVDYNIGISCLDQLDESVTYIHMGGYNKNSVDTFLQIWGIRYASYGPTRNDIKERWSY